MATTIIPAGQTRPVRIPKLSQIIIDAYPKTTSGNLELDYITPHEVIYFKSTPVHHPVIYNIPSEICNITNNCSNIKSFVMISDVLYTEVTITP